LILKCKFELNGDRSTKPKQRQRLLFTRCVPHFVLSHFSSPVIRCKQQPLVFARSFTIPYHLSSSVIIYHHHHAAAQESQKGDDIADKCHLFLLTEKDSCTVMVVRRCANAD
jgi:hypothetical protein